jgi:hypothetical protein
MTKEENRGKLFESIRQVAEAKRWCETERNAGDGK